MDSRETPHRRVRFGTFALDLDTGDLRRAGVPVRLAAQPTAVLLLLVARNGGLVTREDIGRHLWHDRWEELEPGINTCISQIRAALGDNAASPVFIHTVPRRGYRFVAPIERLAPEPTFAADPDRTAAPQRRGRRWPLAAAAILAVGAFAALAAISRSGEAAAPDPRIMLAVLPFQTLDADSSIDYIAAGLTEELITLLARAETGRLAVMARTSSAAAARAGAGIDGIGRTLAVDYVVEGAIRSGRDRLRITARLIRVGDRSNVWAETWDRAIVDVLDVQRDIARQVTDALAIRLLPGELPAANDAPVSPARLPTLEARYLLDRGSADRALALIDSAIAADPSFAPAWTARARALSTSGAGDLDSVRNSAGRALALDDTEVEARLILAAILYQNDRDWEGAGRELGRAIALAPGRADVHHARALYLAARGRADQATAAIDEAMRLDPVSTLVIGDAAFVHYLAGDFDRAGRYATRVLGLDPDNRAALSQLAHIGAVTGRPGMTVRHGITLARIVSPGSSTALPTDTAAAFAAFWRSWIAWWRSNATGPGAAYQAASGFAHVGQADSALAELTRGFELQAGGLAFLSADPAFELLHGDPRFERITSAVGAIPPDPASR